MKRFMVFGLALLLIGGCASDGDVSLVDAAEQGAESAATEHPTSESERAADESGGKVETEEEPEVDARDQGEAPDYGESRTSDRGLLIKDVGQLAGFVDDGDRPTVHVVVTDIVLNPKCTAEHVDKPKNGHYLALQINVETYPALGDVGETFHISAHDFRVWDADGVRINDPVPWGSCLPVNELLPDDFGPADKASGWVLLDVPNTSGTVAFMPYGPSGGGWEWAF